MGIRRRISRGQSIAPRRPLHPVAKKFSPQRALRRGDATYAAGNSAAAAFGFARLSERRRHRHRRYAFDAQRYFRIEVNGAFGAEAEPILGQRDVTG
jgi:hypothetical protein